MYICWCIASDCTTILATSGKHKSQVLEERIWNKCVWLQHKLQGVWFLTVLAVETIESNIHLAVSQRWSLTSSNHSEMERRILMQSFILFVQHLNSIYSRIESWVWVFRAAVRPVCLWLHYKVFLKIAEPNSTPITELFMISESQLWLLKPTYLIALGWEQGLESSLELCLKVHTTVLLLWKRLWGNKYTIKWQTNFVAKSVAPKFSPFFPIWYSERKCNSLQHKLANYWYQRWTVQTDVIAHMWKAPRPSMQLVNIVILSFLWRNPFLIFKCQHGVYHLNI